MFGGNRKDKTPEPVVQKEAQSWDDKLAAALPQKAQFFDAVRTHAYENKNLVSNYVEFWLALQVDRQQDKWRVMHYMIFDLEMADGKFKSEVVSKEDCTFPEAIYHISKFDSMASAGGSQAPLEKMAEKYPSDKYPELKVHFYDIEHYRLAANIEGIAFDDAGHPYRRVEGKVISESTFKRSEVSRSILAVEQARENEKVAAKIEGGILSDIFCSASERNASLENILKVGQSLACMDAFVTDIGAFYLGIQKTLGLEDKFDKIDGMAADEKKAAYTAAADSYPFAVRGGTDIQRLLAEVLPRATKRLNEAKAIGIHVEPFQKFVSECELYAHLLQASQSLKKLKNGMTIAGNSDPDLIVSIKRSVDEATAKFLDLGGSREQVDKLTAWVANPKKEPVPQWLPGFLNRYYDSRRKLMKKIQDRQAGSRDTNTLPAKVKPPVVD